MEKGTNSLVSSPQLVLRTFREAYCPRRLDTTKMVEGLEMLGCGSLKLDR
jgi:hypothetical protein